MAMTDPIADLLTRIRNANQARKERVDVPWSRTKEAVVRVLVGEGFLRDYATVGDGIAKKLRVGLKYDDDRRPVITGLRRVSRPSLRVYVGKDELPVVLNSLGIAIISTSQGLMTSKDARKKSLGGEVICEIY